MFLNPSTLQKQYKDKLSNFHQWDQKDHAEEWMLFPKNMGTRLSIDEVSLSNGELYTIVTNKDAKSRKGALIAMIKGTKASVVSAVLFKVPISERLKVTEITLDMANSINWIVTECFMNATKIIDRFHVQQLVSEAVQQIRIEKRWEAIEEENNLIKKAKKEGVKYELFKYSNSETKRQLLARSRYLLFKPRNKWNRTQIKRAKILFENYPKIEEAYNLSMMFRSFYEKSKTRIDAEKKLKEWYLKVEEKELKVFNTAKNSIQSHEGTILNYFLSRSTNAAAESFNAKLKGFRALVRGVTDIKFFLFRISKFYA